MRAFFIAAMGAAVLIAMGFHQANAGEKGVCLKVNGEKIEIHNLASEPIVDDRDGVPDFVASSMMKSVSTPTESFSYNILVSGVKRDDKKAITSFDVKVDDKAYSYPKDACKN